MDVDTSREAVERWAQRLDYGAWGDCAALLRALLAELEAERLMRKEERDGLNRAIVLRDQVIERRVRQLDEAEAERDTARAEVERLRAILSLTERYLHDPSNVNAICEVELLAAIRREVPRD